MIGGTSRLINGEAQQTVGGFLKGFGTLQIIIRKPEQTCSKLRIICLRLWLIIPSLRKGCGSLPSINRTPLKPCRSLLLFYGRLRLIDRRILLISKNPLSPGHAGREVGRAALRVFVKWNSGHEICPGARQETLENRADGRCTSGAESLAPDMR